MNKDKPLHFFSAIKTVPIGKDEEVKELRYQLCNVNNVAMIVGEGKNTFLKHYYTTYMDEYDLVFAITDFNYSLFYFKNTFKMHAQLKDADSIKELLSTTSLRFLVFVSNMPQLDDKEYLSRTYDILPIETAKLGPNQHIILQRHHRIEIFHQRDGLIFHLQNLNEEISMQLFQNTLVECKSGDKLKDLDTDEVQRLLKILDGNPSLIILLARYLNNNPKYSIKSLIQQFSSSTEHRKDMLTLIFQEIQKTPASYQLLSTFVWFHSYEVPIETYRAMMKATLPSITTTDLAKYLSTMSYYGLYRLLGNEYSSWKSMIAPMREMITGGVKSKYFSNFIHCLMNMCKSSVTKSDHYWFLIRHAFYYYDLNEFGDNVQRASCMLLISEILDSLNRPSESLNIALRALSLAKDNKNLTFKCYQLIGVIYKHSYYKQYRKSIDYLTQACTLAKQLKLPQLAYIYNQIGQCHEILKEMDLALKSYNTAFELVKDFEKSIDYTETLSYIGNWYFIQKDYTKAIHFLRQSIRAGQAHNFIILPQLATLTKAYYLNHQSSKSKETLKQLESQPNSPLKTIYLNEYKEFLSSQPILTLSTTSKYLVTSSLILSLSALLFLRFFRK
ncbi:hypothetical protein DLAC_02272 [Tieghemostelium lacteum]|uniref:Uncharacterized protein n=1 Tax=Tieghemostelium lacteum TaxID=361077 RepID=A0A152A4I9_TIELA|nr:hypothetical protein DLAC_02272 [Tieghemostelium lacteum]|eukprot:KYR01163.1 hypothetical protein DLAC_02272 [Tieghemostelium lacteum]